MSEGSGGGGGLGQGQEKGVDCRSRAAKVGVYVGRFAHALLTSHQYTLYTNTPFQYFCSFLPSVCFLRSCTLSVPRTFWRTCPSRLTPNKQPSITTAIAIAIATTIVVIKLLRETMIKMISHIININTNNLTNNNLNLTIIPVK